jgi:putative DNA primase/helicase
MRAADIAGALGGACRSGGWHRCRCPVHGSAGPTLALRDGARGLVVVCHAGCGRDDILAELRRRGLIGPGRATAPAGTLPIARDRADDADRRLRLARRIWDAARDAADTPVAAYLAGRWPALRQPIPIPATLRYAAALRRRDGTVGPAMVARIDGPAGSIIGVQRTWLARGADGVWRRRDRAMLGAAAGGAVRLAPAPDSGPLLLAEGIETALAGMTATGHPAWAALSTSGLIGLRLPWPVREVIILADHDRSGAGERAAHAAARRWLAEGRTVRIALPPEPGTDMADVLAGRGRPAAPEADHVAA